MGSWKKNLCRGGLLKKIRAEEMWKKNPAEWIALSGLLPLSIANVSVIFAGFSLIEDESKICIIYIHVHVVATKVASLS